MVSFTLRGDIYLNSPYGEFAICLFLYGEFHSTLRQFFHTGCDQVEEICMCVKESVSEGVSMSDCVCERENGCVFPPFFPHSIVARDKLLSILEELSNLCANTQKK